MGYYIALDRNYWDSLGMLDELFKELNEAFDTFESLPAADLEAIAIERVHYREVIDEGREIIGEFNGLLTGDAVDDGLPLWRWKMWRGVMRLRPYIHTFRNMVFESRTALEEIESPRAELLELTACAWDPIDEGVDMLNDLSTMQRWMERMAQ